jgi:alpha-L-rhamnosidase
MKIGFMLFLGAAALVHAAAVENPRCEYLKDPSGIDVSAPRLSWVMTSDQRGEKQNAYQVLVASTAERLARDEGDLWDSGKVVSDHSIQVEYAGKPLASRIECHWKVRVWDKADRASPWSAPARWSMGLLKPDDWRAMWISDSVLADPANRPLTPIHCYRSELASRPDAQKWIVLDLGTAREITSVDLIPARPQRLNPDIRTVMFPLRFYIEVADDASFTNPRRVVDQTGEDFDAPRAPDCRFDFQPVKARFVRLVVTNLARWDGQDYGIALGGLTLNDGADVVSGDARVTCSDSIESDDYSQLCLGKNLGDVAFAPDAKALAVNFPGVTPAVSRYPMMPGLASSRTVSRVPMLRRDFALGAAVKRATLYASARGFYEFHINGRRVGDELLAPGYSDYAKRIAYQSYDVTGLLNPGSNTMAALLGYGWYAGHMNIFDNRCIDGFFPLLLAQLEVELADGQTVTICTDQQWRSTLDGPVRWSDLLDGEGCDCRREIPGWDKPGFDDHDWRPAFSEPRDEVALVAPRCQPVRVIQTMAPVAVHEVKAGVYVFDFGREISGYCRLRTDGAAGARITVRHAELLSADGNINVDNLWSVAAEEDYLLDGKGPHVLEPHFTYHGFRYVEVAGLPKAPTKETLEAVNIHTDVATTGEFTCSNDLYNQIMTAVRWTQWNMLFDVPAGCAGRAERFAWLGDIRPCAQTAMFNMDLAAFFSKYIVDIRDEQTADGRFCDTSPHDALRGSSICVGSPGWADAGVSLPWDEYMNYDDRRILAEHFESAKRWVDFVQGRNPNLLWQNARGMDWGDWLSGGSPPTPKELGATAFFAHSADLLARMADALGRKGEAAHYRQLFQNIRMAFVHAYVGADGAIGNGAEGCYALALQFDLLDEPLRSLAVAHLVDAIAAADGHPTTGFWSSGELLLALSSNGQNSAAARMMSLRSRPSWGYMVDNSGTLWESFYADTQNLSLNHWTHSAVGEWLWRNVAGINPDPESPGFQSFTIHPRPSAEVTWCKAGFDSIHGRIAINWSCGDGRLTMDVVVPANATAKVYVPTSNAQSVTESGGRASQAEAARFLRTESGAAVYEVGSGKFQFQSEIK